MDIKYSAPIPKFLWVFGRTIVEKVFKCGTKFGKMDQVLCGNNVH